MDPLPSTNDRYFVDPVVLRWSNVNISLKDLFIINNGSISKKSCNELSKDTYLAESRLFKVNLLYHHDSGMHRVAKSLDT